MNQPPAAPPPADAAGAHGATTRALSGRRSRHAAETGHDEGEASGLTSWLAGWRVAARIARRDARRNLGRTCLIVTMLMIPALAASVALVLSASSVATPNTKVDRTLGAAAQAQIAWYEPACPLRQTADGGEMACAAGADQELTGLSARELSGLIGPGATLVDGSQQRVNVLAGVSARPMSGVTQIETSNLAGIVTATAGRLPVKAGEVLLDAHVGRDLNATPGSRITLRTETGEEVAATVTGLGSAAGLATLTGEGSTVVAAPGTLPGAGTAQSVAYVLGGQAIDWAAVERLNARGYEVFSRAVVLDPPASAPQPGSLNPTSQSNSGGGLMAGFAAIGVLEVVLIIGPAFAVGARRLRHTLALLAVSGGTPRDLSRLVRATGLALGGLAGLLGTAIGAGGAAFAVSRAAGSEQWPNLVLPWPMLAVAFAVTALLGMAAAWLPGRMVARLEPVAALRQSPDEVGRKAPVPWAGLAVLGAGCAATAYGAAAGDSTFAMVGGVVVLVGIVLLSGVLVWLTAHLAPHSGIAGRLALRDANRHRSRTAPALAAVIGCVAGGTMSIGMTVSIDKASASEIHSIVADGLITVADDGTAAVTGEQALRRLVGQVEAIAPISASLPVAVVDGGAKRGVEVTPLCPGFTPSEDALAPGPCLPDGNERTWRDGDWGARDPMGSRAVIVDDGRLVGATGLPGAEQAAAALKAGHVLVNNRALIDANGDTAVRGETWRAGQADSGSLSDKTVKVPASYVPWSSDLYQLVIPPQLAKQFDVGTWLSGYLLVPAGSLTGGQQAQINGLSAARSGASAGIQVKVSAPEETSSLLLLALAAIAALIAAAATWIAVGLAKAETRPDMATLAAVGASPGTRRRFAGAQAAAIAAVGAIVGSAVGLAMEWVVINVEAKSVQDDAVWVMSVPWLPQLALALGVPLIAIAGAMLATRSRLPALTRRLT